ncbi:hypothetical protein ASE91_13605 [Sphingomonas sp. Leaf62]|nr:hypothetical protein ASE91_13605 [Sphingomonas sp. Leaf62]
MKVPTPPQLANNLLIHHREHIHSSVSGRNHGCHSHNIGMLWLPIEQVDKLRIIRHLRISRTNKMLCRLSA